ncbi:hypothetical protein [Duganella sp. LjRoot269]|jgi:hypothetical protein|uniref:hypothetical protein n=1 Tax=Duganella sp. LjRoot269 TaxID=3342305 RepID=UPI003ECFB936
MSTLIPCTPFINILVKVKPGSTAGTYKVETAPAIPCITEPDTVINYQIFDSGSNNIVFTGMKVLPVDNGQLSAATVSVSGKQLTFSDANTSPMTLNITLNFKDEAGVEFMHDPEVQNEPE